jgi:hypothetical protein
MTGIKKWARDAAERAVRAFVSSFTAITLGGSLFSVGSAESLSLLQRAAIAGLGSATSVILSLAAKWANDPDSAGLVGPAA